MAVGRNLLNPATTSCTAWAGRGEEWVIHSSNMTPSQTLKGAPTPPTLPVHAGLHVPSHHHRQFEVMGAHHRPDGTVFTVWAPNARSVAVVGSFNGWHPHALHRIQDGSGRWCGTVAGPKPGDCYKYRIRGAKGETVDK